MNVQTNVEGIHPLFDGGDYETGRRLIDWLEQELSEQAFAQLGLRAERRDRINAGSEGLTTAELEKVLGVVRVRCSAHWECDSDYLFFAELLSAAQTELPAMRDVDLEAGAYKPQYQKVVLTEFPKRPSLRRTKKGFWVGPDW